MSKPPASKVLMSMSYMKDKYCHQFWDPEAPPNAPEEDDISGKIIIVTGANAGIGRETALHLAKRGAKVILGCRDLERAQGAVDYIKGKVPKAQLEVMQLDLASLKSIREFVEKFQASYDKLDILVNNAGFMTASGVLKKTSDGFEYHMGVNHLGPFLLTHLLLPYLKKSGSSKIICVASSNMMLCALDLSDLMMEKGMKTGDEGLEPYDISKLANALCMRIFACKIIKPEDKIKLYQLCPGFVKTEIFRNDTSGLRSWWKRMSLSLVGLEPKYGCETSVYCCVSKGLSEDSKMGHGEMHRFSKYFEKGTGYLDPEDPKANQLYKMSLELVGLSS